MQSFAERRTQRLIVPRWVTGRCCRCRQIADAERALLLIRRSTRDRIRVSGEIWRSLYDFPTLTQREVAPWGLQTGARWAESSGPGAIRPPPDHLASPTLFRSLLENQERIRTSYVDRTAITTDRVGMQVPALFRDLLASPTTGTIERGKRIRWLHSTVGGRNRTWGDY